MKKKSKNQIYIPHRDKWNEHFPTPGKPKNPITTQTQVQPSTSTHVPKKQTEKEMKTPLIPYTRLSLTHRDKIYHQTPPTNNIPTRIIPLILLETVILRYT